MEHKGIKQIETDRLILRKFTMDDVDAVFDNWASDPIVTEFLRWPAHSSTQITKHVMEDWIKQYDNMDCYRWAIVLKENGSEPIGIIDVVDKNEQLNILHIGYCIGRKWWHRGITSEAFSAIIPFLFNEVKANRIESQHDPNNPNSGKVMLKCGLKYEGTMRQADISNKGIVDASMYAILREDWENENT